MNTLKDFTKNPFIVPDNFFSSFNEELMAKLPQKESKRVGLSIKKHILPWIAVAAVISGAIFMLKDSVLIPQKSNGEDMESVNVPVFSSTEDQNFYLYLQDDVTNKEVTTGNIVE